MSSAFNIFHLKKNKIIISALIEQAPGETGEAEVNFWPLENLQSGWGSKIPSPVWSDERKK